MISSIDVQIQACALHKVGNKLRDEGIQFSNSFLNNFKLIEEELIEYFFSSFKSNEYFSLYHETDLGLNEVYTYVTKIFDNLECLYEQSLNLSKHLYEQSNHPKIKGGEFYVVYFKDCMIDGKTVDAVGLFKSENKDIFLNVYPSVDGFEIESRQGINIKRLDKGCLIFNADKEHGYVIAVVDNMNKGTEAHYWIDDFLHVRQRKDKFYNTQNVISLTKSFITKELPKVFEISKVEQVDLLNKSEQYLKEKDTFNMDDFANKVIVQPEVIDSFNRYKENYQLEREIEIADNFVVSEAAVKKQVHVLRSVIKLDKNFHIYIHGNNQYIKKGYDENSGMYYYQLFFKEEE